MSTFQLAKFCYKNILQKHCHFVLRYGNPKKGIAAQSNRVLANGGLSPLRWSRTSISEPATLELASAGQSSKNPTVAFLNSLPPKVIHIFGFSIFFNFYFQVHKHTEECELMFFSFRLNDSSRVRRILAL